MTRDEITPEIAEQIRQAIPAGQHTEDLHQAAVITDDKMSALFVGDNNNNTTSGDVEAVFRNLEGRLIEEIEDADAVIGCAAWMTSKPILQALAKKKMCCFVLNKEDFVSPSMCSDKSRREIIPLYDALPWFDRTKFRISELFSSEDSPFCHPVRVAGIIDRQNRSWSARMHNKFAVFFKAHPCGLSEAERILGFKDGTQQSYCYEAKSVWTGSFNFTFNATRSLENAIIIRDSLIADAYECEFGTIFGISEPIDWRDELITPQYSLGPGPAHY